MLEVEISKDLKLLTALKDACDAKTEVHSDQIIQSCSHENELIGWYACKAIGVHQIKDGVDELLNVLSNPAKDFGDHQSDKRLVAAWSFGKFSFDEVGARLLKALESQNDYLRIGAADALGEIGDPRAISQLVRAVTEDTYEVALWASLAASKIGEPALHHLNMALEGSSSETKKILIQDAILKIEKKLPA